MTSEADISESSNDQVSAADSSHASRFRSLRVWPALVICVGIPLAHALPSLIEDGPAWTWMVPAFIPLLCSLMLLVWWLTSSRARWSERLVGGIGIIMAAVVVGAILHPSMLGPTMMMVTIPMGLVGFAAGAVALRNQLSFRRTVFAVLLGFVGFGFSGLLRAEGMWGNFLPQLDWRWNASAEERLLAAAPGESQSSSIASIAMEADFSAPDWPGLRGAEGNSRVTGMVVDPDWANHPPELIWKIPVGPGWSSFAKAGDALITQEQRGKSEVVVCYHALTGEQVWIHETASRFDDPLGGPGPRATPAIANGALFAFGARGELMRLDPATGDLVWQVDVKDVANAAVPMWGFSSSPVVLDDLVMVHAAGDGEMGVLAFDVETGQLNWSAAAGKMSYGSPQLATICGAKTILMASNTGMNFIDPVSGTVRLAYDWPHSGYRACQPQVIEADSVLIPTGLGAGTQRLGLAESENGLVANEEWTSLNMKPDFNDFVVHDGHLYGFDNTIFASIDLETGDRNWKGGRYGKGQVLLLADCNKLLVTCESGEVVLLDADPAAHHELGKFKALEGKTWGHPIIVGDRLYLRNSQEAACYRMPIVSSDIAI